MKIFRNISKGNEEYLTVIINEQPENVICALEMSKQVYNNAHLYGEFDVTTAKIDKILNRAKQILLDRDS